MKTIRQIYSDIISLSFDKDIIVRGWVQTCRASKKIMFVKLTDGSDQQSLQIIFDKKNLPVDQLDKITTGVSLEVTGKLVKSLGKGQSIELLATHFTIIGMVDAETYPIPKVNLTLEYLRQIPHLRIRTETFQAITRIKSVLRFAMAKYFNGEGFCEVQVPCITDNECESGCDALQVTSLLSDGKINNIPTTANKSDIDFGKDFFGKRAFLSVSGQLHLECMVIGGLNKAWCMTTAFRGEKSTGPRHLAEFWMAELEACFTTLEDNMKINEDCIKYCFKTILEECPKELAFMQEKYRSDLIKIITKYAEQPFIISSHEECVRLMLKAETEDKIKFEVTPKFDDDLTKEHERYITEVLYDHKPVFVRYFPAKIKAFYMPKIDEGAEIEHVDGFDLLFPEIGEIVGGSQRISNYDDLQKRMLEMGVKPESLQFYSDLRKYGTVPHGGSGIGFDRLMLVLCGGISHNIKDMVPFPRSYQTCLY